MDSDPLLLAQREIAELRKKVETKEFLLGVCQERILQLQKEKAALEKDGKKLAYYERMLSKYGADGVEEVTEQLARHNEVVEYWKDRAHKAENALKAASIDKSP